MIIVFIQNSSDCILCDTRKTLGVIVSLFPVQLNESFSSKKLDPAEIDRSTSLHEISLPGLSLFTNYRSHDCLTYLHFVFSS